MTIQYGVTAFGNALVDVLCQTSDEFIASQAQYGMVKGGMTLIDTARAEQLYAAMGPCVEVSGGSAGNTMAVYASFGGRGAYTGKVADDALGRVFIHDLQSMNVTFTSPPLTGSDPTGRCLILVTPDAQRTMNTYLGAASHLREADVDEKTIAASQVIYLEGYLFDMDECKKAYIKASRLAHQHGRKVSLTLSDTFCVDRHRDDFRVLVRDHVDILFANEAEILSLYQTADLAQAMAQARAECGCVAITRSEKGSVILDGTNTVDVAAYPVSRLVDTTGAGDAYAGGFLFGLTTGRSLAECGKFASYAAAEVISHMGPRPEADLSQFLKKAA